MKEFFLALNSAAGVKRPDIIEKDYHLHRMLHWISNDGYLGNNLIFKGGTCLIKAYLDYYRFSEDIDFTWAGDMSGESRSETKRKCSLAISQVCESFKKMADELGYAFSGDKGNSAEVHISSGGLMAYFNLGYESAVLGVPSMVKIEFNFMESLLYPTKINALGSYMGMVEQKELKYLYEELWNEYTRPISLTCYDPREIYVEKCRAALTRMKYKLRDALDIYFIEKKFGYTMNEFRSQIIQKTRYSIDLYNRYGDSIEMPIIPPFNILKSQEMDLLLVQPPGDMGQILEKVHSELESIRGEILEDKR